MELFMRAGCRRRTFFGKGVRGCGVENIVRIYRHCTISSCQPGKGQIQRKVVETWTPHMLRKEEDGWTVFANCDGRDGS